MSLHICIYTDSHGDFGFVKNTKHRQEELCLVFCIVLEQYKEFHMTVVSCYSSNDVPLHTQVVVFDRNIYIYI
jgi:hypothetical protein